MSLKAKLARGVFYSVAFVIAWLPHSIFLMLVKGLAALFECFDKRRKKDAMVNLNFVYGDQLNEEEKQKIIKRCYLNFAFSILDSLRLSVLSKEKILEKITFIGKEAANQSIEEGKPFVIITAHYGHWELASICAGIVYGKVGNVGRVFGNEYLDAILFTLRERFNVTLINKKGGMKNMLKIMNQGCPIGLVIDQNTATQEGILVDFFDKKVRHTPAAAILARRFESVIIPVFVETNEDYSHFKICFRDPIKVEKTQDMQNDILKATQQQATLTQEAIQNRPHEWLWFHQRFKNQYEEIYD